MQFSYRVQRRSTNDLGRSVAVRDSVCCFMVSRFIKV